MIITWNDTRMKFKPGDTVWACAFKPAHDKESKQYFQRPIQGKLMAGASELSDAESRKRYGLEAQPTHFVPFKKGSTELAWSKAVTIYARWVSDSFQECTEKYKSLVQEQIDWHEKELQELRKEIL